MATVISQKDYLKKYLSKKPGEKKKKKKKDIVKNKRITVIDDSLDLNLESLNKNVDEDEDAPQIVAVIDERPPCLRVDDNTKESLWIPISAARSEPTKKPLLKGGFKIGKSDSIREDKEYKHRSRERKRSSDIVIKEENFTPPRRISQDNLSPEISQNSSSPRYDSDLSPLRQRYVSPPGRDLSPPRRKTNDDLSPPRKRRSEESLTPSRKSTQGSSSSRGKGKNDLPEQRNYDSSPPRKKRFEESPPRRKTNEDSSPPRRNRSNELSKQRSDLSPPRRKNESHMGRKQNSNKPSRWGEKEETVNEIEIKKEKESPPRQGKKMTKTLDGKTAGLQDAQQLAKEAKEIKDRENRHFETISKEMSGQNAVTIVREKGTGRIRNMEEEYERLKKKQQEEEKNKEQYSKWGRGLVQIENREKKLEEQLKEMEKPLARYANDEDLEKYLKGQEREGDPMLAYIRNKKRKDAAKKGIVEKPTFEGLFMPNRYGIRPGHRWDGVDRSNGYEKKWFEVQNEKVALQEESYKWSTEDM